MTHEALAAGGERARSETLKTSVEVARRPRYLGQYWGLGSECYMVWWLHGFYKPQQWAAFSVTAASRPGQSPFSPSLPACLPACVLTAESGPLFSLNEK